MLKLNPHIEEAMRHAGHGTILDGVFASQAIDTSGEVVDIKGADISSLNEDGVLNTEHNNPDKKDSATFSVIIGRIIFAKKIFSEEDCESERELDFWNSLQLPFIYGASELFDAEDHENAKAAAAIIRHYHKRNLPVVIRYSVEGSTIERNGNHLLRTIARRIAATIKPCNRSAISNLVSEPSPTQVGVDAIEKSENIITSFEMEAFPLVEDPILLLEDALSSIKELNKALTLGSSDAMPSSLTQGAALAIEDVSGKKKKEFFKSQVLAAARDWDGLGKFEEFLKHRLPDADPDFVIRFAQYASEINFRKAEPTEAVAEDHSPRYRLRDLNTKPPSGTKQFKGKHVIPGEVELVAGPFQGSKLKLMHLTDKHAYVKTQAPGGEKEITVNKISRNKEGTHFVVNQRPQPVDLPNFIHGDKHGDLGLTQFHEQKELMHGIDLSKEPSSVPFGDTKVNASGEMALGWYKNLNGQLGFVKPAIESKTDDLNPKGADYINSARREVVFHNTAKNFFGLGEHVPTTSLFKHPDTKHEHSVMQLVQNATHTIPGSASHESADSLRLAGDSGQLDKLAVMDTVMGQGDRNRFNYLTTKEHPSVHLIDNAMNFNYTEEGKVPTYLTDYHNFKSQKFDEAKMHPEALRWLANLDPFELGAELTAQGVHQSLANKAVVRLLSMKSEVVMGKNKTSDILFAHGRYAFNPVNREVG